MFSGASENHGRGWINGESRYSGSTYRLPVAFPVSGAAVAIMALAIITAAVSILLWNHPVFIDVPLSKVISTKTAWLGFTHYLSMNNYNDIYSQIITLPKPYLHEVYIHTFGAMAIALIPSAFAGWYVGKPRSVIRHISGVRLREGKDAIRYANKMISEVG